MSDLVDDRRWFAPKAVDISDGPDWTCPDCGEDLCACKRQGRGLLPSNWEPVTLWDCPTCGPDVPLCEHFPCPPTSPVLETKPSNPKDLIGSDKLPVSMVPATAIAYACLAHLEGTLKYGRANWRECGVRTSIYLDAMQRHMMKFGDAGQWADPKTHVPHLASIIACAAIILDAQLAGKLIDDRPKPNPELAELIDKLGDTVKHLKELFKEHNPHHYLITDLENRVCPIDARP